MKTESNYFPSLPLALQSRQCETEEPGSVAEKQHSEQHSESDEWRWLDFISQDAREKSCQWSEEKAAGLKRVRLKSREALTSTSMCV